MSAPEEVHLSDDEFSGVSRVFPLPNLVMFPHVVQALRIFEPRYRMMLEDALAADGLIAMALLSSGWEKDYDGRHPIYPDLCLGRVISHTKANDGTYNILLLGLRRTRLIRELPPTKAYREAELQLLTDRYSEDGDADRSAVQRRLMDCFRRIIPKDPAAREHLEQLLGSEVPLGVLTDLVAYSLHLEPGQKQQLLAETDVDRRAEFLVRHLEDLLENRPVYPSLTFPPEFGVN